MLMKRICKIAIICFIPVFVFFMCARAAGDARSLTVKRAAGNAGVKAGEGGKPASAAPSRAAMKDGVKSDGIGYTEFDDFNNVSDPLYRAGSKALLKKAIDEDRVFNAPAKKIPAKPELMRDAPADIPAAAVQPVRIKAGDENKAPVFPAKRNRLIKLIPADPVKTKSTL